VGGGEVLEAGSDTEAPHEPCKYGDTEEDDDDPWNTLVKVEGGGWVTTDVVPDIKGQIANDHYRENSKDDLLVSEVASCDSPPLCHKDTNEHDKN